MKLQTFEALDHHQQLALMLALHIRNELEDFHVDHQIPDEIMPELNSTIRYAIYDFFVRVLEDDREFTGLVRNIPRYWEIPGIDPKPVFAGEYLFDGKPLPKKDE